jgi:hypothetical protein
MASSDRVSAKLDGVVYGEIIRLAADYRIGVGELVDMMLEYAVANIDHVDEAWSLRRADGSGRARKRREASS